MVSERVDVQSKDAVGNESNLWSSDGKESYSLEESKKDNRGTCITLNIKKDADEFLDAFRLRAIITKYSNYIPFPIYLKDLDNKEKEEKLMKAVLFGLKRKKR